MIGILGYHSVSQELLRWEICGEKPRTQGIGPVDVFLACHHEFQLRWQGTKPANGCLCGEELNYAVWMNLTPPD
jgi:hypothetical protein